MQFLLFVIFALCWVIGAIAGDAQSVVDSKKYVPRYTLLAESKKQDQDSNAAAVASEQLQPWRRLAFTGFGGPQSGWPASGLSASPTALLGPGMLLLGVNLGALLYMLLALLGLAPPQRLGGVFNSGDIYRNDRQQLGAGKETDMYF
ncbi:uncharacterized protein LOC6557250 [Drosophila grimshawi]|uniref:GH14581 n=1 Tax=Drosophila grimshawi TaxID=7222 RepID=B4IYH6_DROGR|nr:uncharacterized protein LOC6557250 [Drosophila grimshawi]EDV97649.1 GH14581 [Drosophila grimshawi]